MLSVLDLNLANTTVVLYRPGFSDTLSRKGPGDTDLCRQLRKVYHAPEDMAQEYHVRIGAA